MINRLFMYNENVSKGRVCLQARNDLFKDFFLPDELIHLYYIYVLHFMKKKYFS
jgi:hypothetical protein